MEDIWRRMHVIPIPPPQVITIIHALLMCNRKGNAPGASARGIGRVLSFYVNSTVVNPNQSRKKSKVPQDYSASIIPCGKRGEVSRNLTVSEL